ncbi:hypothetical protein D3C87_2078610 [compost metagenome]
MRLTVKELSKSSIRAPMKLPVVRVFTIIMKPTTSFLSVIHFIGLNTGEPELILL